MRFGFHNMQLCILSLKHLHGEESICSQDSGENMPEDERDSNSDLDEGAALRFYRNIEEQLKLKRKGKTEEVEE